jgi:hypothetical protein
MKKILAFVLAFAMLGLAACGNAQGSGDVAFTVGGEQSTIQTTEQKQEETEGFYFLAGDVMVIPGMIFDADVLPAESVYQVPSCAFEGTDNVYSYGSYEITAFNDGEKELVYSIFFVEPDVSTPEGLANGDELSKAKELSDKYNSEKAVVSAKKRKKETVSPGKLYSLSKLQNVLGKTMHGYVR